MFLTKECDYALRVIRELADGKMKPVKTIGERELVPIPFAYKILKKLERAGIVASLRGMNGGYRLVRDPAGLTIYDIVTAVDDNLFINECIKGELNCPRNPDGKQCCVHYELSRVQQILAEALSEKTMDELV